MMYNRHTDWASGSKTAELFRFYSIREAAKKRFFSGSVTKRGKGEGKGRATKKIKLFLKLEIKIRKCVKNKIEGGG